MLYYIGDDIYGDNLYDDGDHHSLHVARVGLMVTNGWKDLGVEKSKYSNILIETIYIVINKVGRSHRDPTAPPTAAPRTPSDAATASVSLGSRAAIV